MVKATPQRIYPRERHPVLILRETVWAPGYVSTCAENLDLTGIRFADRPARSVSHYRLSYRGPHMCLYGFLCIYVTQSASCRRLGPEVQV